MSDLYAKARQAFAEADIDWPAADVRALLIDTADYTVDLAAHDFLDDVPAGARLATAVALAGKAATDGWLECTVPIVFPGVGPADDVGAVILYIHTGTESTSRLITYIDVGVGFPLATNGNDVELSFPSSRIARV